MEDFNQNLHTQPGMTFLVWARTQVEKGMFTDVPGRIDPNYKESERPPWPGLSKSTKP